MWILILYSIPPLTRKKERPASVPLQYYNLYRRQRATAPAPNLDNKRIPLYTLPLPFHNHLRTQLLLFGDEDPFFLLLKQTRQRLALREEGQSLSSEEFQQESKWKLPSQ